MKIFISADIEGIATTTTWNDADAAHAAYPPHAAQMTDEVLAVIAGAKKAGATEFIVRDAHAFGTNIDPARMPAGVTLLRGWSGHPYSMADGVDSACDAAMFVGYHSAAGSGGNPLSHTNCLEAHYIKLNGAVASEFTLYSYAAALEGVPSVFLSGDAALCHASRNLHPALVTCPVKDGRGSMTISMSPVDALAKLTRLAEQSLKQDLQKALVKLPEHFDLEICYKEHKLAEKAAWYPGAIRKNDTTITFSTKNYFEILRAAMWIM